MRYRWAIVLVTLIGLAVLGRMVSPEESLRESNSTPSPVATEVTAKVIPTPEPGATEFDFVAWDIDGDGSFTPSEMSPVMLAYADFVEFAPGYEFDEFRFGNEINRQGWMSWSLSSPDAVVTAAQTCSWVQYWMESTRDGDGASAEEALAMLQELRVEEALGELGPAIGAMTDAAGAGDADRVQNLFTGARCHLTYFVDDSIGPQGVVPQNPPEAPAGAGRVYIWCLEHGGHLGGVKANLR